MLAVSLALLALHHRHNRNRHPVATARTMTHIVKPYHQQLEDHYHRGEAVAGEPDDAQRARYYDEAFGNTPDPDHWFAFQAGYAAADARRLAT